MINLDPASPEYTQLGQANVYLTNTSFDFEEINEWAFLNGSQGSIFCTGVAYADKRYSGVVTIQNKGYKTYTSLSEIIGAFEEAYNQGKEYCDVLFDFRNTNMTHNEAVYAITNALSGSQINAYTRSHAILSEQHDGLLLYRLYFR